MTYARVVVCERLEDQPSCVPLDSEDAVGVQLAPAREQTAHPRNVKQLWTQSLFRDGHRICMFNTLLRKRTVPGKVWLQAFAEIYMRISDARVIA